MYRQRVGVCVRASVCGTETPRPQSNLPMEHAPLPELFSSVRRVVQQRMDRMVPPLACLPAFSPLLSRARMKTLHYSSYYAVIADCLQFRFQHDSMYLRRLGITQSYRCVLNAHISVRYRLVPVLETLNSLSGCHQQECDGRHCRMQRIGLFGTLQSFCNPVHKYSTN